MASKVLIYWHIREDLKDQDYDVAINEECPLIGAPLFKSSVFEDKRISRLFQLNGESLWTKKTNR